jgi:periplasmic copper chaperone A
MRGITLASATALSLLSAIGFAQQNVGSSISVEHAWARASAGTTGAAYLSVTNQGTTPDRLLAVETPAAERAALHESTLENGVMKMRPLGPVTIAPGQSLQLKPGADHVMLMGLKHPLKAGESFPLTLTLEKAGDVQVTVKVEPAGAMGADASEGGPMPPMDHRGMK